jgi:hypothetical protein
MKKLYALVAALVAVPMFAFAMPVFADSPGSLATGPDLYQVRNVTKNGAYASNVSAACNETVKYSIKLANSEFGLLTNVIVKASLTGGNMTASATNAANQNTNVGANVTVTVPQNATLTYVAGSTVNLNANGGLIANLPDGITTTNGVNKGNLNGSTREFVQFQAKVTCETVEVPKDIRVCELATKKFITIKENQFDATKHSKNPEDCKTVEVPKDITVCELATKKVITIKENQFDASKHSKNLNDCKTVEPGKMTVCELATKKVIEINKDQFDAAKHTEDLNKCAETPVTPEVLPNTGTGSMLGIFAAVSVAAAVAHRLVWTRFSNR